MRSARSDLVTDVVALIRVGVEREVVDGGVFRWFVAKGVFEGGVVDGGVAAGVENQLCGWLVT